MKKIIYILLALILFQSCKKTTKVPRDLIQKDKMSAILIDIHEAEGLVTESRFLNTDSAKILYERLEKDIFKKHKVDTALYYRSYEFYANTLDLMESLYKRVVDTLHIRDSLSQLEPLKKPEKKDTIKNRKTKKQIEEKHRQKADSSKLNLQNAEKLKKLREKAKSNNN